MWAFAPKKLNLYLQHLQAEEIINLTIWNIKSTFRTESGYRFYLAWSIGLLYQNSIPFLFQFSLYGRHIFFIYKFNFMNIFVGNLSFAVTENQLNKLFSEFGAVSKTTIVTDKYSGRSRGFGFVEMINNEEAHDAISRLEGKVVDTRTIVVNEAKPRTEPLRNNLDRKAYSNY